jgi:hypothetical protein
MQPKETITIEQAFKIHQEHLQQTEQEKQKHEQNLAEAREAVFDHIEDGDFSYSSIEGIMDGYGLEMDYVEEWLI